MLSFASLIPPVVFSSSGLGYEEQLALHKEQTDRKPLHNACLLHVQTMQPRSALQYSLAHWQSLVDFKANQNFSWRELMPVREHVKIIERLVVLQACAQMSDGMSSQQDQGIYTSIKA